MADAKFDGGGGAHRQAHQVGLRDAEAFENRGSIIGGAFLREESGLGGVSEGGQPRAA